MGQPAESTTGKGDGKGPRWLRWLPLALLALIPLYLTAARGHTATFNHDDYQNDQKVYLRIAQKLKASDYEHFTPRQRTPGFSYVLSAFWKPEYVENDELSNVSETWFERGKQINIVLSVFLLAGLCVFFQRTLGGTVPALLATLACGFLLYVFRAGYTQPELLYWSLNVVAYYLLMRMLWAPGWGLAVAGGAVSAAAYFVKAGTQPLMLLFVVSYALKLAWDWWRQKKRPKLSALLQGAVVPAVFVALLAPYLMGSYRVFGNPFYSTYSKHIMWVRAGKDSFKNDMYAVMNAGAADRPITQEDFDAAWKKLSDKPPPEIPTLGRYLRTHTAGEIIARPFEGLVTNHKRMQKYYPSAYLFLQWLLWTALVVAALNARKLWPQIRSHLPVVFYVTGFFAGYLVLYGWYDGLRIGARLILSLYVPAVFTLIWFIAAQTRGLVLRAGRFELNVRNIAFAMLAVVLVVKIVTVLTGELYANYSGA